MANYFNWRQDVKTKSAAEGKSLFLQAVKNDEHAEKVRDLKKDLPDRQKSSHGRPGSRASSNARGGYRAHSQLSKSSNSSFGSSIIGGGGLLN